MLRTYLISKIHLRLSKTSGLIVVPKGVFMLKTLLVTAFTLFTTTSIAMPPPLFQCSCTQNFEDFLGNESEVTVHVTCPTSPEEYLECSSKVTSKYFSATCKDLNTSEENTTKIKNEPGTKPSYGYVFCRLN